MKFIILFMLISNLIFAQEQFVLLKDTPAPFDGILVNEDKYRDFVDIKLKYKELQETTVLDQKICEVKNEYLKETQKTKLELFIEEYDFEFGVFLGVVFGFAAVYAANQIN